MTGISSSQATRRKLPAGPHPAAPVGKSPTSRKRMLRLAAFSLFASMMALLISSVGWLLWIDNSISDRLFFRTKTTVSGKVILVVVDDETIRRTGRFPYDRAHLVEALTLMQRGGATRVYLDVALSHVQSATSDKALEEALLRFPPQTLSLPVTRMARNPAQPPTLITPLERFSQNATLTSFDGRSDSDGRVRIVSSPQIPGYQSTYLWLHGTPLRHGQVPAVLDFSIPHQDIPRISLLDVANGKVEAEVFRDKLVIFGSIAEASGAKIDTPKGALTRVEVLAIATETALKNRAIKRLTVPERILLVIAIAALLGLAFFNVHITLATTIPPLLALGWGASIEIIFRKFGLILPLLPVVIVILIFWQRALLSTGAGMASIRKLRNRLLGVDHSTLLIALDAMPDSAILFDQSGKILGQNMPFQAMAADLMPEGKTCTRLSDLCGDESAGILNDAFDGSARMLVVKAQTREGQSRFFEVFPRLLESATGFICIAGLKDITARVLREEELVTLAFRDALTGLANRLAFQARLEAQCTSPDRQHFAVLLLDLDGFKKVNDTLGHDAGDQLLAGVAGRLKQAVPNPGVVARLGGDEFAIMLPYGSQGEIRDLALHIHQALQPVFLIDGKEARVGTSIGIAYAPRDGLDARLLTKRADAAMYRAKRNKPSSCEFDHRFDGDTPGALIRTQNG